MVRRVIVVSAGWMILQMMRCSEGIPGYRFGANLGRLFTLLAAGDPSNGDAQTETGDDSLITSAGALNLVRKPTPVA